jgi:hypothetical protein
VRDKSFEQMFDSGRETMKIQSSEHDNQPLKTTICKNDYDMPLVMNDPELLYL